MKDRRAANTFLFLLCVSLYLVLGLIWKFTDLSRIDVHWYYYIVLVPLFVVGWFMLTCPRSYIRDKLQKSGMSESRADSISLVVFISLLVGWALVFGAPD